MKNWITTTMTITKWSYFSVLIAGLFLTSCEGFFDDLEEDLQPVVDFIEDITEIQEGLEDAMTLSEDAITVTLDDGSTGYLVGECAIVTNDEAQDRLTIDFGDEPCEGLNGKMRSGMIIINYIDETDEDSYSYSIDFERYTVDGNEFDGLLDVAMLHRNENGKLEFSETVTDARITLASGKWYGWSSERMRTMTNGDNTPNVMDDVYQITGNFNGQDSDGNVFSTDIKRPITFLRACWEEGIIYPSTGRTRIEMTGKPATVVDWGLGFCNKTVNILQWNKWLVVELN